MRKNLKYPVFIICCFCFNFIISQNNSQDFQPTDFVNQSFKEYNVFSISSQNFNNSLRSIAPDIEALDVNTSALLAIQNEKPKFIRFQVVQNVDTFEVKMQRHHIMSEDFVVRNHDDELLSYEPGLYYRGIIDGKRNTLAVFNFFSESVNGIISEPNKGNKNIGQLENSNQYIIYTDNKMTVTQDFVCEVDDLEQQADLIPQSDISNFSNASTNCVKVFYELTNDIYTANSSSINDTMNWITSVHNIVATLYSDSNIPTALSDVLIWQQADPYTGSNSDKLNFFRQNRIAFNGDVAHLLDLPVTGGVAYVNSLCQSFRYAFSGVSMNFSQLPTYSWTVNVVAHEMGHSLGSPHTHACFWNGDASAIDSCGPNNGFPEGCNDGPVPSNGGTVMSYCHLDATGVNLALGFHPQVGSYMSTNTDTKSCLGTDCIDSCMQTVAGVNVTQADVNNLTINIDDVISDSWDYRIFEEDTFPGNFTTTNTNSIPINNIIPNTYYIIQVLNNCSNGNFGSNFQLLYLSDDDWCSTQTFTDTGGLNGNYKSNQNLVKTFYPSLDNNNIKLTINNFDLEINSDFMTIYDGESTDAPVFPGGSDLTGSNLSLTTFEATNPEGAITVKFTSNFVVNISGWDITVSCQTLSTPDFNTDDINIYPNPVSDLLNISSKAALDQLIIYDLNGKVIVDTKAMNQDKNYTVDLSQLSSGLYLMKLKSGKQTVTKRIIKR